MEEKLIALVEHYPCSYNNTLEVYRRRDVKKNAWEDIARELGISVKDCEGKWKSLRDKYRREREKQGDSRSGSGGAPLPQWDLMRIMEFIEPFTTSRSTSSNISVLNLTPVSPTYSTVEIIADEQETNAVVLDPVASAQKKTALVPDAVRERKRKYKDTDPVLQAIENMGKEEKSDDPDEMFMLCLVPDLRQLPNHQKYLIKIEILKLVAGLRD